MIYMDKIDKFLLKLSAKLIPKFEQIVFDVLTLNLEKYDVKKMKGYDNRYRLRVGKYRIIFEKLDGEGRIIDMDKRGDIY